MTVIEATVTVHRVDDVTFSVDTGAFLDAIGSVDRKIEDALNDALDAYVDEHAYYHSERWYSLTYERDGHKVLRECLAATLGLDVDDVTSDYGFCTCNWENVLSEDFGGTLWNAADGRRWLTLESGARGSMNALVGVRAVTCEEPAYTIEVASRHVMLGCTPCEYRLDTSSERITWSDLTRDDGEGWALDGLFCPRCDHAVTAAVHIE